MSSDVNSETALVLDPRPFIRLLFLSGGSWQDLDSCEQIAKLDAGLRDGSRYPANRPHRLHLQECSACRRSFPRVVQEYERLDRQTLATLGDLLRQLRVALLFDWARVEQLGQETWCFAKEDFDDEHQFESEWNIHLDAVQEVLFWRGVVLAHHVGRLMALYAATHVPSGNPWIAWRRGADSGIVSRFLRTLAEDELIAALAARNVHLTVNLSDVKAPLTLPSDGDLSDVPHSFDVVEAFSPDEWSEVLGDPPGQINCQSLVGLAVSAAVSEAAGPPQQEVGAEMLRKLSDLMAAVESNSAAQMPMIDALNRIEGAVAALGTATPARAEESLRRILGDPVYSGLCSEARRALVAGEQLHLTAELANPSLIVFALAQAFEFHLKTEFFAPVLTRGKRLRRLTLGAMVAELIRPEAGEVRDFCREHRISLEPLRQAARRVNAQRVKSAHKGPMDRSMAEAIREDWLGIAGGNGGVFGVLVPRRGTAQ